MRHGSGDKFKGLQLHLGESDGEDGMGAAAGVIHASAGCGAVGIAKNNQILHVLVAVHWMSGQIYTQVEFLVSYCLHFIWGQKKIKIGLTLNIGSIYGVLSYSQGSTICGCSTFPEKVLHIFIIDLQIAGAKVERQTQKQIQDCIKGNKLMKDFRVDTWMAQNQAETKQAPIHCQLWKEMHSGLKPN